MLINQLYNLFKESSGIQTDSRKIKKGELFFALKGGNFDGNKFASKALNYGAGYAVIDDPNFQIDDKTILVDDVLTTLQQLAHFHRKVVNPVVIAITGSNGKTTTKELLAAMIAMKYRSFATVGNFNNHIGVPLTLLQMPDDCEIIILELGDNHPGEIEELCEISNPDFGYITNVGKDHLEGFGNMENNYKAKSELYDYLANNEKKAFLNLTHKDLLKWGEKVQNKICFAPSQTAYYNINLISAEPFIKVNFTIDNNHCTAQSKLFGLYNFENLVSSIFISAYFGISGRQIKEAIEQYSPQNNRSQMIKSGTNTILLDAYNANPSNVEAALNSFRLMKSPHKWIILGDMLELGSFSKTEHERIAELAVSIENSQLTLVGKYFEEPAKRLNIRHFIDALSCKQWFDLQKIENHLILIKGSRGIRLETIIQS
jgi:UDP-N-acetylmuramoyl-tripeptide--D-alanyl-D-alanine ligase